MRKLEQEMWRNILNRTPVTLMNGNLEVLPLLASGLVGEPTIVVNMYGCKLATITPHSNMLKVTFHGDCWDGASSTVMSRVRALCVGYKVTKSGSDVTFTSEGESKLSNSLTTCHLSEKGYSLLVDLAKVRLAIQP